MFENRDSFVETRLVRRNETRSSKRDSFVETRLVRRNETRLSKRGLIQKIAIRSNTLVFASSCVDLSFLVVVPIEETSQHRSSAVTKIFFPASLYVSHFRIILRGIRSNLFLELERNFRHWNVLLSTLMFLNP